MPKNVRPVLGPKAAVTKGALLVFLQPRLAMDASVNLDRMLAGITQKNFAQRRDRLERNIVRAVTPQLAKDASVEGLADLLDALEESEQHEADDTGTAANAALPVREKTEEDEEPEMEEDEEEEEPYEKLRKHLASKLSAEDVEACDEIMGRGEKAEAEDEESEENKEGKKTAKEDDWGEEHSKDKRGKDKRGKDKRARDGAGETDKGVSKAAMDSAITAAVRGEQKRQIALRAAEEAVRPYIGAIIAMDSAEEIYKVAFDELDVDYEGVHPSAFPALLKAQEWRLDPKIRKATEPRLARDSASGFAARFPDAAKIGTL